MTTNAASPDRLKYLTPENLYQQIEKFTDGMAVTRDKFELVVPNCTLQDFEWNHMDQMHRFSVHNTYEKNVRVAFGTQFAVSLTQWGKWPLFIRVSDVFVARGVFYQTLTIAGIFILHSIITMEEVPGTDSIKLTDEWFIASHRLFRFLHKILNKKLHKLNVRLQQEDEALRQGRFSLRKAGYRFQTDTPNYFNSNRLTNNTIYPVMGSASVLLENISETASKHQAGAIEFIAKKTSDNTYLLWPAACPHEGGPLITGKLCDAQITCPWHGLRFSAVELSVISPMSVRYGFEYFLQNDRIIIKQLAPPNEMEHAHLVEMEIEN
jgi:nitrite reductase/ring-hydroxylating ferredoxin subunit